jgi:phage terminase small subunit
MARPPNLLKPYTLPDPDPSELGPAMLACTALQRRFVRGFVSAGGKNLSAIAEAAGYSNVRDGAKVRAQECLHNPKVLEAVREEVGRTFTPMAVMASHTLRQLAEKGESEKVRLAAADKILGHAGFVVQSKQEIIVRREDGRSTADLMSAMQRLLENRRIDALPVIEGEVVNVSPE